MPDESDDRSAPTYREVKRIYDVYGRKVADKYCRHYLKQSFYQFMARIAMGLPDGADMSKMGLSDVVDDLLRATQDHIGRLQARSRDIGVMEAILEFRARGKTLDS